MSEYDFEAELRRLYGSSASAVHYQSADAALRRAYAAGEESGIAKARVFGEALTFAEGTRGWDVKTIAAMTPRPQASGGGSDLAHRVTLAAGLFANPEVMRGMFNMTEQEQSEFIRSVAARALAALKAQAVAK